MATLYVTNITCYVLRFFGIFRRVGYGVSVCDAVLREYIAMLSKICSTVFIHDNMCDSAIIKSKAHDLGGSHIRGQLGLGITLIVSPMACANGPWSGVLPEVSD